MIFLEEMDYHEAPKSWGGKPCGFPHATYHAALGDVGAPSQGNSREEAVSGQVSSNKTGDRLPWKD
jgi:hypothetical protein